MMIKEVEMYFKIKEDAIIHLSKDAKMKKIINNLGILKRPINKDFYSSLIEIIIGQQISTKAANTVRKRFITSYGSISVNTIDKLSLEEIQLMGISFRKANYIKSITKSFVNNQISYELLSKLSDEEVIKILTELPGIGRWSAKMILIFTFERENVISFQDLGIRRGLIRLYNLDNLDKKTFINFQNQYSPYNTTASIYLWELSK